MSSFPCPHRKDAEALSFCLESFLRPRVSAVRHGRSALRRDVALSRAGGEAFRQQAHVEIVALAVALRGREAEQVLAVQLVGDPRERGGEILAGPNLDVAAARFLRDAR